MDYSSEKNIDFDLIRIIFFGNKLTYYSICKKYINKINIKYVVPSTPKKETKKIQLIITTLLHEINQFKLLLLKIIESNSMYKRVLNHPT